jgi:hypothetical protein
MGVMLVAYLQARSSEGCQATIVSLHPFLEVVRIWSGLA